MAGDRRLADANGYPAGCRRLAGSHPAPGASRTTLDDLDATWAYRGRPEVTRWLTSSISTLEEYRARFEEQARGVQAELGWVVHPDHAGRGYGPGAVRELVRLCFDDLWLRRVTANCFVADVASWRLMERVGMRRELYTVRESLHRSGEWLDGIGYALLADEWRGVSSSGRSRRAR